MAKRPSNTSKGTTTSTATTGPSPIGVEKGYQAERDIPGAFTDPSQFPAGLDPGAFPSSIARTPPRYFAGEEWRPATLSPDEITNLQLKLQAAGLYTSDYHKGVWDAVDANAYARLLGQANASGDDQETALQRAIAAGTSRVDTTPRKPLTVTLTNADDIRDVVTQVGNSLYGGQLPDSTRESIVAAVHAQEQAAQEAAYNMDPTGGTLELGAGIGAGGHISASALQSLTARTVRQQHPNEVGAGQFASAFDAIMSEVASNPSGYQSRSYSGLS